MNDLITSDRVIAALLGMAAGVVGSLIAPWVQWAIQKRRSRFERRCEEVDRWRAAVANHEGDIRAFGDSPEYAAMRPRMDPEVVKQWEGRVAFARGGRGDEPRRHMLLDEIARIEREWGLV